MDELTRNIIALFGAEGTAWLAGLPGLIAACERRWQLRVLPPFELSYHYVAPAVQADGTAVVLKLGPPGDDMLEREIAVLRAYDGRGAARLIDADPGAIALLLERLTPGTTLAALADDDAATAVFADVMRALHRPAPPGVPLPTLAERYEALAEHRARFGGTTGPLPRALCEEAETLVAELLASAGAPVVLHGDLHHLNILRDGGSWRAIDPHGLTGDPAAEVGPLLVNPPGVEAWPDARRITARRIALLAELLGYDRARIRGWGLAHAMLSACWSVEDHGSGWERAITCGEWIAAV